MTVVLLCFPSVDYDVAAEGKQLKKIYYFSKKVYFCIAIREYNNTRKYCYITLIVNYTYDTVYNSMHRRELSFFSI